MNENLLIGLGIAGVVALALVARTDDTESRLVLSPAHCLAARSLGTPLPDVPGGCLYAGPADWTVRTVRLGHLVVPRDAVLADVSGHTAAPTQTH